MTLIKYVLFMLCISASLASANEEAPKSREYILPWTKVVDFTSELNQQKYELIFKFPNGYGKSGSNKRYPVVYVLDAQYHYPLVSSIYGNFNWDGTIEDAIVVGITWGGEKPDYNTRRQFDLTPTTDKNRKPSGNAANFLKVLKTEIFPFVEKHYKASTDRTLTGSSYSGLFAMYALFNEPDLFHRIIALSPSLWWDNRAINTHLNTFKEAQLKQETRLYIARGEYELGMKQDIDNMITELSSMNKDHLVFKSEVVSNAGHSGVNGEGFAHGIRFVFSKPEVTVKESLLKQYAGVYVSDSQMVPEIVLEFRDNQLKTLVPGGEYVALKAAAPHHLYLIEFGAELLFDKNIEGKADSVTLKLPRNEISFTRK